MHLHVPAFRDLLDCALIALNYKPKTLMNLVMMQTDPTAHLICPIMAVKPRELFGKNQYIQIAVNG